MKGVVLAVGLVTIDAWRNYVGCSTGSSDCFEASAACRSGSKTCANQLYKQQSYSCPISFQCRTGVDGSVKGPTLCAGRDGVPAVPAGVVDPSRSSAWGGASPTMGDYISDVCGGAAFGDGTGAYPNPAWPKLCASYYCGSQPDLGRDTRPATTARNARVCHDGPPDANGVVRWGLFSNMPYVPSSVGGAASQLNFESAGFTSDIHGLADGTLRLRSASGLVEANICLPPDSSYFTPYFAGRSASTSPIASTINFDTPQGIATVEQLEDGTLRVQSANSLECVEAAIRPRCAAIGTSQTDSWCRSNCKDPAYGKTDAADCAAHCNCDGTPTSSTPSGGRSVLQTNTLESPGGDSTIQLLSDGTLHLWSPTCVEVHICKYANKMPAPVFTGPSAQRPLEVCTQNGLYHTCADH
jgi:hypothetical protein